MEDIDNYLTKIYYSPSKPGSYSGVKKLWNFVSKQTDKPRNLTYSKTKAWLELQTTHTIHKDPAQRFPREKIIVPYPDSQWDCDLIVAHELAKYNKNHAYILVVIDLFSRYCWARAIKTKASDNVINAFRDVLTEGRKCETLRTDRGVEFCNKHFEQYLKNEKIMHIKTFNEKKAAYAERMNLNLQKRLYKYFYEHQTYKYIDILQDLIQSYNNTVHSVIGMRPSEVNTDNALQVYTKVYLPIANELELGKPKYKFQIGDAVRISYERKPFSRAYKESFTEEIFLIRGRIPSKPHRYLLKDIRGSEIQGSFYQNELQKVRYDAETEYKISKILGYKTINGVKHAHVSWYGWPDIHNSYIPASQIVRYKGKK